MKMNWEEEHKNKVAGFPDDIREAHRHSANHRSEIENSSSCGCFYCRAIFCPERIAEWVDEDNTGMGQTALCPYCGIDSVIGDKSSVVLGTSYNAPVKKKMSSQKTM